MLIYLNIKAAYTVLGDVEGHLRNKTSSLILKTLLERKVNTKETLREKISEPKTVIWV